MKDINLSQDFSKNGIVKIENILSQKDTDKLHQIVLKNCKSKVEGNNSFPTNYSRLINYIKKPKRLIDSFSILQIYSKYNFLKIANEVTGHNLKISYIDGYVSEKSYEGDSHWLMFLFDCALALDYLPKSIDEGRFKFFSRAEIEELPIPPSDHQLVWPYYDKRKEGFWGLRADCSSNDVNLVVEAKPPQT